MISHTKCPGTKYGEKYSGTVADGCTGAEATDEPSVTGEGETSETFAVSSLLLELEVFVSFDVVAAGSEGGVAGTRGIRAGLYS